MVRIGVLASGTGTNFDAIQKAISSKKLNAEIATVISDKESAPVLLKARAAGIDAKFIDYGKNASGISAYILSI